MNRIVVIGSSCSGKSTLSQFLANKLNSEYIELDQLHWLPNRQERPDDEFRNMQSGFNKVSGSMLISAGVITATIQN